MIDEDQDDDRGYASPACSMHDVDPAYMGLDGAGDTVKAWRKEMRRRLIDARSSLTADERERRTSLLRLRLDRLLPNIGGLKVSVYWPFRGEPDLRGWMASATDCGATCLLPVVIEKESPLVFRSWRAGEELVRGVLNIPVPPHGEQMRPDIVIAPVVGFDARCYRLGIGGGYFDRTLAALHPKPMAIGVGFDFQQIETIRPQSHDIPMDAIVTDTEIRFAEGDDLPVSRLFETVR